MLLGVPGLAVTPDKLFRRAGLLPAEGEYPDEGFWELWEAYRRLAAEERRKLIYSAVFLEENQG